MSGGAFYRHKPEEWKSTLDLNKALTTGTQKSTSVMALLVDEHRAFTLSRLNGHAEVLLEDLLLLFSVSFSVKSFR